MIRLIERKQTSDGVNNEYPVHLFEIDVDHAITYKLVLRNPYGQRIQTWTTTDLNTARQIFAKQ